MLVDFRLFHDKLSAVLDVDAFAQAVGRRAAVASAEVVDGGLGSLAVVVQLADAGGGDNLCRGVLALNVVAVVNERHAVVDLGVASVIRND